MPKRGLNKKGTLITQRMLIHLGMFVILGIIWWVLQSKVKAIEKDTEFQRIVLSRDVALLLNTFYTSPGDIEYNYSNNKLQLDKFEFIFEFDSSSVSFIRVKEGALEKIYPYSKPFEAKIPQQVLHPKSIKFLKKNNELEAMKNE